MARKPRGSAISCGQRRRCRQWRFNRQYAQRAFDIAARAVVRWVMTVAASARARGLLFITGLSRRFVLKIDVDIRWFTSLTAYKAFEQQFMPVHFGNARGVQTAEFAAGRPRTNAALSREGDQSCTVRKKCLTGSRQLQFLFQKRGYRGARPGQRCAPTALSRRSCAVALLAATSSAGYS